MISLFIKPAVAGEIFETTENKGSSLFGMGELE
jgi:hypothetical protein